MMESLISVDEIIIDIVREHHCIYDKRDADFKNIRKKKDVWQKISENLKNIYEVNMTAEEIEKRWSSLRDMFSRENRRQKLPPSGSGYEPTKEWELYRNMSFLIPHVAHRRTKTSFVLTQQNQSQDSLLETSITNTSSPSKQSFNLIISSSDDNYSRSFQPIKENRPSLNENEENIMPIDNEILKRPASTLSSCSSSSSSMQFSEPSTSTTINMKSQPTFKSIKKITPELDEFAKRRKTKDDQIDRELAEASNEISAAMKTISSQIYAVKREKDGYMFAIEEGLKYVPSRNKTQCVIEVLQIIQKYEERQ